MCRDCCAGCLVGTLISCADCAVAPRRANLESLPARPVEASRMPRQRRTVKSWKAFPNAGSHYEVDPIVLQQLQQRYATGPAARRRFSPGVLKPMWTPKQELHEMLLEQLGAPLSPEQQAARQRLHQAFSTLGEKLERPDLMIKIVPDLDLILFNGILTDNIMVSWQKLSVEDKGRCNRSPCKAIIQLNKSLFAFDGKWEVLGILIHEMIHAYFMVLEKPWDFLKGEHPWFPELAEKIVGRLGLEGFEGRHIL